MISNQKKSVNDDLLNFTMKYISDFYGYNYEVNQRSSKKNNLFLSN